MGRKWLDRKAAVETALKIAQEVEEQTKPSLWDIFTPQRDLATKRTMRVVSQGVISVISLTRGVKDVYDSNKSTEE